MTLILKTSDHVAQFLEYVAGLIRLGIIKGLAIHMQDGQISRATVEFKIEDPPVETVTALKEIEAKP